MKLVSIILFLLVTTIGYSKKIPSNILQEMSINNVAHNAIIYVVSPEDCISCNYAKMKLLINFSTTTVDTIYFLFESNDDKARFEITSKYGELDTKGIQMLGNRTIYNFFKKKEIISIKNNFFDSSTLKQFLSQNSTRALSIINTFQIPKRDTRFYHQLFIQNNIFYAFNSQICELRFMKNDGATDSINLNKRIDKNIFFNELNLNFSDSTLTKNELFNSNIQGNRFIDFLNYCPSQDGFHFTISVNYTHLLTAADLKDIQATGTKVSKELKGVTGEITTTRNMFFLIKFDTNFNLVNYYKFDKIPQDYASDFYTQVLVKDKKYITNIKYYPKMPKHFASGNYAYAEFQLDDKTLNFEKFSTYLKPTWFDTKKIYNNFSIGMFQQSATLGNYYILLAYPHVVDLDANVKFQIPDKSFKELAKFDKNNLFNKKEISFMTLGILDDSTEKIMIIRSISSKNVYAITFNLAGNYVNWTKLIDGSNYDGFFCVINGKLTKIKNNTGHTYSIN